MIRVLALRALLFAVPFAIYGAYLLVSRARSIVPTHDTPWTVLFVSGLGLVVASFVYLGLTEGESTQGRYVAPHVVNGKVVPGHVEKGIAP
ncbi:MAG TPA: DUF6111 family protein [Rhizomicrobium sp.]